MTKSPCLRVCKVCSAYCIFFYCKINYLIHPSSKQDINAVLDLYALFMHALQLMECCVCLLETLIKRQVTRNDCLPRLLCDGDRRGLINFTDTIAFVSFSQKF